MHMTGLLVEEEIVYWCFLMHYYQRIYETQPLSGIGLKRVVQLIVWFGPANETLCIQVHILCLSLSVSLSLSLCLSLSLYIYINWYKKEPNYIGESKFAQLEDCGFLSTENFTVMLSIR